MSGFQTLNKIVYVCNIVSLIMGLILGPIRVNPLKTLKFVHSAVQGPVTYKNVVLVLPWPRIDYFFIRFSYIFLTWSITPHHVLFTHFYMCCHD